LALWGYARVNASRSTRLTGLALRIIGLAALASCLVDPMWTASQPRPGANTFAIVADNSQGMEIQDRGETKTRAAQLRDLVAQDKAPWQMQLAKTFQLRRYLFDSRLLSTRDYSELKFDGRSSAIHHALADLTERYRGQPLAGVLLFTDGNATDLPSPQQAGLPPIYPVLFGKEGALRDLSIASVSASQSAFEDAPVTIQAEALASGFVNETIVASVIDITGAGGGKTNSVVAQSPQSVKVDNEKLYFRFQIKPQKRGLVFYRVQLAPERKEGAPEATMANNDRVVTVDRGGGPYRILYIAGRPDWEYKFLKRAILEDEQMELAAIIRIARREPKFTFRGRAGESSNPLFRGFAQTDEETERYDQPVLIRDFPNTMDKNDLRGGFPKLVEDLYRFHAIIIDDLESDFFTADQKTLIQRFVADRGGGMLMLGGPDSFIQGKYDRTPIGDMLPFYLSGAPGGKPPEDVKLKLTREGWLQPWARLRATENEENIRLAEVRPLFHANRVGGLKPGASLIATVIDDSSGKEYPALAVQRFGHGRTAAMTIAGLWRGSLGDEELQKDLAKTWRQLARWLTTDVPEQVKLELVSTNAGGSEAVTLRVRAKDKAFQPIDSAIVTVTVEPIGGEDTNRVQLTAEAAPNEAGVYETVFVPRQTGGYRASATVVDATGRLLGHSIAGWASEPLAEEFRSLQPNRALLEQLARQTGGELITAEKLSDFVDDLKVRRAPIQETISTPIWDKPLVFLFALGCFVGEWGLRRMRGLA
jgi:uncharacterized membrane protein